MQSVQAMQLAMIILENSNSVVGGGCSIGYNVTIYDCYIWHNVKAEDGYLTTF